jgi:hypothetical protein
MENRNFLLLFFIGMIVLVGGFEYFVLQEFTCPKESEIRDNIISEIEADKEANQTVPEGLMVLIEYKDTVGLVNFVNELKQRDISSALLATPEFVEDNCETIKTLTNYGVEIIGSNTEEPFWDIPYQEQYDRISEIKDGIESCTGKPLKIIGSRFFASDENTVRVAEELGIPYVTARGTTGQKATVYKPTDYNVKILSISNIESINFKYGSLCDYSYWTRQGEPEDMKEDLEYTVSTYNKLTPVSHTNIGGYLKRWFEMWKSFWDENEIQWVSLDEMMSSVDYEMEFNKIPQNRNFPYTPEMLEHVEDNEEIEGEKVDNPCSLEGLIGESSTSTEEVSNLFSEEQIVMFHNNQGAMCLDALEFFEENNIEYKEVLNTDSNFINELNRYKDQYPTSEGLSDEYGYFPLIFTKEKSFSGFNNEIKSELLEISD